MSDEANETLLTLTADIVAAHVGANNVPAAELPGLIAKVHEALSGLASPPKRLSSSNSRQYPSALR